jgi:hypothetical protein
MSRGYVVFSKNGIGWYRYDQLLLNESCVIDMFLRSDMLTFRSYSWSKRLQIYWDTL